MKSLIAVLCFSIPALSQTVIYNGPNYNGNGWSTQTTKVTPASVEHSKEVSNLTTLATGAALVYFFEVMPGSKRLVMSD
jgi:hypothetical protein